MPPVLVYLAKNPLVAQYDLSSIRQVSCGAAPLSRQLEQEFSHAIHARAIEQGITVVRIVYLPYIQGGPAKVKPTYIFAGNFWYLNV